MLRLEDINVSLPVVFDLLYREIARATPSEWPSGSA